MSDGPLFPAPLLAALAARPDAPAVEHGDRVVTCGELLALVGRLVDGLRTPGLGPGRGVAVATGVTPEALAAIRTRPARSSEATAGSAVPPVRLHPTPGRHAQLAARTP